MHPEPPKELNDVSRRIPSAILDIRYASPNNFTDRQLYDYPLAWLRPEALTELSKAAAILSEKGFRIVIYDAYRSPSVQKKLRQFCDDDNYVMEVSNHCRGITVDIGLADANGEYIDMGSEYDEFSPKSHSDNKHVSADQAANRSILTSELERLGFVQHPYEWWHFDFRPDVQWEIVNDETNTYTG